MGASRMQTINNSRIAKAIIELPQLHDNAINDILYYYF
jgi:hypothetical protein